VSTPKVTMQVIANRLGVTKVSVSKALNNHPGVSVELRNKILQVSHELGYLVKKPPLPIGSISNLHFLVSKRFFVESDRFYTTIYFYLSKLCNENKVSLSLAIIDQEDGTQLEQSLMESLVSTDGIFIAGELDDTYLHAIQSLHVPTIAIAFYKPHFTFDCVITDNFYACYMSTVYLVDRGHTKIGFVGNPTYSTSVMDRFYGYLKGLHQCGLEHHAEWDLITNDISGVYYNDIPLSGSLPSSFVCHCDMAAYHLILILKRYGIQVPEHVSLISFDNTALSQNTTPPLTTVDIDTQAISDKAFTQMLWRVKHPDAPAERLILSTQIIERESVMPPSAASVHSFG